MKLRPLLEGKQLGILYHYIETPNFEEILKRDRFPPGKFKQPMPGTKELIGGVSLTRLKNDSKMKSWFGRVIFALDGDKLSQNYKIKPVNDAYLKYGDKNTRQSQNMAEEFVFAPSGIKNISKYIIYIALSEEDYDVHCSPDRMFYIGDDLMKKFEFKKY